MVLILVFDDVLAVFEIEIRIILDADHFVVMHAFGHVAGPIGIIINLEIIHMTSRIRRDSECFGEVIFSDGSLSAAFSVIGIEA